MTDDPAQLNYTERPVWVAALAAALQGAATSELHAVTLAARAAEIADEAVRQYRERT